ncbi:hypothetical protein C8Q77DRAFT_462249 [Trametes polyzona]|nr:hypothetical protein C8Q77DRAFT_462249 [Trametes polyzona]
MRGPLPRSLPGIFAFWNGTRHAQAPHPFLVPPRTNGPHSASSASPTQTSDYTWVPEARMYVATKGGTSPTSLTPTSVLGKRVDADLPPIPSPPTNSRSGGPSASAHEDNASYEPSSGSGRRSSRVYPSLTAAMQHLAQHDAGATSPSGTSPDSLSTVEKAGIAPGSGEAVGPPLRGLDREDWSSGVSSISRNHPRSDDGGYVDVGGNVEGEEDGPPPYAPRA